MSRDAYSKARRDALTEQGKCINGAGHAPPVPGQRRCEWCRLVHRKGAMVAMTQAYDHGGDVQPPPGYRYRVRQ